MTADHMTGDDHWRRMEAARVRAELTVHDLWMRYLALGGTDDAFDVDGYLQGLVSLEDFQQRILAQALNEGLDDLYRAYRIPPSTPAPGDRDDDRLRDIVEQLLHPLTAPPTNPGTSGDGSA